MLKKLNNLFLIIIVMFTIYSCYLGKKIEHNLVIYIDKSSLITKSISNVQQPIYLNYNTTEQYAETFYNKLLNEVTYQTNISITDDVNKANYTLKLNYFEVAESESRQVVNDAASPYNGQTYFLSEIDTKCNFDI